MEYMFQELVEEGKCGNQEALETLINHLKPLIFSTIKRYGWSIDREDLYQEACMAVLEGVYIYDPTRQIPFLAFIKSKLRFHIYNKSKKQRVVEFRSVADDNGVGGSILDIFQNPGPQPDESLIAHEELSFLNLGLEELEDKQKKVILLHYYRGDTLKNIALEMGLSYKTVLRLKGRALKALSNKFRK